MVETQETAISEFVDQRRIIDLPLNGRQATDLIILSGGAAVPSNALRLAEGAAGHDYISAAVVSVSGGQIKGNNYLLDGGDHNDSANDVNLPLPFFPTHFRSSASRQMAFPPRQLGGGHIPFQLGNFRC